MPFKIGNPEAGALNPKFAKLTTFDPAEGLTSDEAIAALMQEAFKTEDAAYVVHALSVVARAKSMTQAVSEASASAIRLPPPDRCE